MNKLTAFTFSTVLPYKADSALLPSGLLGPVTLQFTVDKTINVKR